MIIIMMMTTMLTMLMQLMMAMIMILIIIIIIISNTENGREEKDLRSGHILGSVLIHGFIYNYTKYRGIYSKVAFILLYFVEQGLSTCP